MTMRVLVLLFLCFLSLLDAGRAGTLDAITFAAEPGKLFIPVNEAVDELGWQIAHDDQGRTIQLNASPVSPGTLRQLLDGTELVSTAQLAALGSDQQAALTTAQILGLTSAQLAARLAA